MSTISHTSQTQKTLQSHRRVPCRATPFEPQYLFAPSANMDTTISNPLITWFHLNNIDTTFRNLAVVSFTAWRRGGASLTRHPPVVITNSQDEIFLDEPFSFPRPWNQNYDRFLMASTQELSSMIRFKSPVDAARGLVTPILFS